MSFQTIRRHSSSKQNLKIKELLDRLARFEASQLQIEDEDLIFLGFADHTRIQYHDEVKFTKATIMTVDDAFKLPVEPDGKDLTLWYRFDSLSILEDASFFGHTGIQHGDPVCRDAQIIEGMDEGMNMGGNIAVRFNGINQYITTKSTPYIDVKDSTVGFSIFTRFNIRSVSVSDAMLFQKIDNTNADYGYEAWFINVPTTLPPPPAPPTPAPPPPVTSGGNFDFQNFDPQNFSSTIDLSNYITENYDDSYIAPAITIPPPPPPGTPPPPPPPVSTILHFFVKYAGSIYKVDTSSTTILTGTWYDTWFVFDKVNLTAKIYLNNVLCTTVSTATRKMVAGNDLALYIGASNTNIGNTSNYYFDGYIQDYRFWNQKIVTVADVNRQWINKLSISNIVFNRVGVIAYSIIPMAKKAILSDTVTIGESLVTTYRPTNPTVRNISDTVTISDLVTAAKNVIKKTDIEPEVITISESLTIQKLSLFVKIGQFAKSTSTTTDQSITGLGFTPKFIIFWGSNSSAVTGKLEEHYDLMLGFTDGTNERGFSIASVDNQVVSNSKQMWYNYCINDLSGNDLSSGGPLDKIYNAPTPTDDKELSDSSTFDNRTKVVEYVSSSSSTLKDKIITQFDVPLKKVGAPAATPTISAKIWNSSGSVVYTSSTTIAPNSLTTSYTTKTFDFSSNTHVMVVGDRIGIEWTGTSSSNYVVVGYVDGSTVANTTMMQYEGTSWDEKTSRDLSCVMWIGSGILGPEILYQASCNFDVDGFTLHYISNESSTHIINYIAMGGSTITNAEVGSYAMPATALGQHSKTGLSFQPDAVFFMPTSYTTANHIGNKSSWSFGVARSATQAALIANGIQDGVTTSNTFRYLRFNKAVARISDIGDTVTKEADFVQFNNNGWTLDFTTNSGTADLLNYLAIKGATVYIGKFSATVGTGVQSITGVGFRPKVVIILTHGVQAQGSSTMAANAKFTFGAATDSLNRFVSFGHDVDAVGTTVTAVSTQSNRIIKKITAKDVATSSTIDFEADFAGMTNDGFDINKIVNDGTTLDLLYMAIGTASSANLPPPPTPLPPPPGSPPPPPTPLPPPPTPTPPPPPTSPSDIFGITKLYPSVGREWFAKWNTIRSWNAAGFGNEVTSRDPNDSETFLYCPTGTTISGTFYANSCSVTGGGIMRMQGTGPGLFIKNPGQSWQNVEITVYVKKVSTYGVDPAGTTDSVMKLGGPTQHDLAYLCNLCGYGYYAEVRDGSGDEQILKELLHLTGDEGDGYATLTPKLSPKRWTSGFPTGVWVGYKLLVQICDGGTHVRVRYYRDETDGLNGGTWQLLLDKIDIGDWGVPQATFDLGDFSDSDCLDPANKPNDSANRILMNAVNSCFFRIYHMQVDMKKASVREIAPLNPLTGVDQFGIKMLHTTKAGGRTWFSNWHTATSHQWDSTGQLPHANPDPQDPMADLIAPSTCRAKVDGAGVLTADTNSDHNSWRFYILDPACTKSSSPWKWSESVETTVYYKAISDMPSGSIHVHCRVMGPSEHWNAIDDDNPNACFSAGHEYGFEIKKDGTIQLRKELAHANIGAYADNKISATDDAPYNQWIGMKLITQKQGTKMKVEGYRDMTDGLNGGTWIKMIEFLDDGTNWLMTSQAEIDDYNTATNGTGNCVKVTPKEHQLDMPASAVGLRCDNTKVMFKKYSVREIASI